MITHRNQSVTLLFVEDRDRHFASLEETFRQFGFVNDVIKFKSARQVADFLLREGEYAVAPMPPALLVVISLEQTELNCLLQRLQGNDSANGIPMVLVATDSSCQLVKNCPGFDSAVLLGMPLEFGAICEAIRKLGLFFSLTAVIDGDLSGSTDFQKMGISA